MTTDREVTAAVAAQSGADEAEARAGLVATLEALGARLAGGSVDELAATLPADAADALRRGRTPEPEQGSLTDLSERVGAAVGGGATEGANLVQRRFARSRTRSIRTCSTGSARSCHRTCSGCCSPRTRATRARCRRGPEARRHVVHPLGMFDTTFAT